MMKRNFRSRIETSEFDKFDSPVVDASQSLACWAGNGAFCGAVLFVEFYSHVLGLFLKGTVPDFSDINL